MKIRLGPPGVQIEDEVPSPIEVLGAFGSPIESPGNKLRRLAELFRSYSEKNSKVEVSGKLDVRLVE